MAKDASHTSPVESTEPPRLPRPLPPEPHVVDRVIHGQRVQVKIYPPMSDPSWSDWIRHAVRAPMD